LLHVIASFGGSLLPPDEPAVTSFSQMNRR